MKTAVPLLILSLSPGLFFAARQTGVHGPTIEESKAARAVEDGIAQKIVDLRKKDGLKPLARVNSVEARRLACTEAHGGKITSGGTGFQEFTMYMTGSRDAGFFFDHIALFPDKYVEKEGFNRFSVGAWPAVNPNHPAGTYGIAIVLISRPGSNFFAKYFTDGILFRHEWEAMVAPECQNVK
jgi:hypothetical protein